jgi:3-hydroxybutyryl-CoA dehydrogenase
MRIAALAGREMIHEIRGKRTSIQPEWIWLKSIQDLKDSGHPDAIFDFEFSHDQERIDILAQYLPKPIFVNAVATCLKEIRKPFIRFNGWPGFFGRDILEMVIPDSGSTGGEVVLRNLGWPVKAVPDIPGLISARIVSLIINEAYYTFQEGISSREEIDTAMKLGTSYPLGPFAWCDLIGLKNVYTLLLAMQKEDQRYTIAESLAKEAAL